MKKYRAGSDGLDLILVIVSNQPDAAKRSTNDSEAIYLIWFGNRSEANRKLKHS